jgi:hypothetical protein
MPYAVDSERLKPTRSERQESTLTGRLEST